MDMMIACVLSFILIGVAFIVLAEVIVIIWEAFSRGKNNKKTIKKSCVQKENTSNCVLIDYPNVNYKNDFIVEYEKIGSEISNLQNNLKL